MYKLIAIIFILTAGGEQPTGIELKSRASFADQASCEAFKDSDAIKKDRIDAALAQKSEEDGVTYKVKFECRAFDDGSI